MHCHILLPTPIWYFDFWDSVDAKIGVTLKDWTTYTKVRVRILKWVIVRIATFFFAHRYQNRIPEVLNYQKLVSHAQIWPKRAERDRKSIYPLKSVWSQLLLWVMGYGGYGLNDLRFFWNSEYKLVRPPWATLLLRARPNLAVLGAHPSHPSWVEIT